MSHNARLAEIFKTLSNPNRLEIFQVIRELTKEGIVGCDPDAQNCVGAIGSRFKVAPSTLSDHLKELKRAGLIEMTRSGRMIYCCVSAKALDELKDFVAGN